jgi:hypothetical protein
MTDPTEDIRRTLIAERQVSGPLSREQLAALYNSNVWDTDELREEFEVLSFLAPYVAVRRRADGVRGSMEFQHSPRYYWGFMPN